MFNSTSTPEPVGECYTCGFMVYRGCFHTCPSVPFGGMKFSCSCTCHTTAGGSNDMCPCDKPLGSHL